MNGCILHIVTCIAILSSKGQISDYFFDKIFRNYPEWDNMPRNIFPSFFIKNVFYGIFVTYMFDVQVTQKRLFDYQ